MNKLLTSLCVLLLCTLTSYAQHHNHTKEEFEKIEAAKIAHITTEVGLTPKQAEDFWPLYNEYSKKRRELKHKRRSLIRNSESITDDKVVLETFTKTDELKKMEFELDQAYRKRFLLILTPSQVMKLYRAEKDFFRMIMRKIHEEED